MFKNEANQNVDLRVLWRWWLMSFCVGVLNVVAFIGLGTFATHVTGFATLFGVHAATLNFGNALAALAVPLFFLLGAVVSGLGVEARVRRNKIPHYDYVMYFAAFLLVVGAVLGRFNDFNIDIKQTHLHIEKNIILLSLICFSSGLVNAALSYSSHSTVRVTHLTGVTTDLGRGIAELISLKIHKLPTTKKDHRVNFLHVMTIFSFVLGSLVGAFLFQGILFDALIIPAVYFIYAGMNGGDMGSRTPDL